MANMEEILKQAYRPTFEWMCRDHPKKEEFLKQWDANTIDIDYVMNELEHHGGQKILNTEYPQKDGFVRFEIKKNLEGK